MNGIFHEFRWIALVFGALCLMALPAASDQTDPRLPSLFEKLRNAEVFSIAHATEREIWAVWLERQGQPDVSTAMDRGLRAMREADHETALAAFSAAVRLAPDFAEAWNKRATIHYLLGDYAQSIADIRRTLALEPRHFGALSGLGLINLQLDRKAEALEAFEAALKVHPYLPVRSQFEALREAVAGEKI
jgi:tetratricopeptide (TPR) repeat protein